ncbi:LysR family transcriptional regulator [Ramlibacter rhizophilus]|uniref:LysR family transcriptional regulator n=1 Tax=Ramlibacter rhizophilus TaxID=1781167 RepID=A0A4Z0BH01_9BURK|nr:LysR family transcriptional regulator [Ramlibacter rhizophilus]TFY98575.1 LysR family transcriptional regulator [Ramlibacter rhizophilus]
MQTKWLEDLIALSQTGSLTRAAQQRHVTHPALGRRLRALEAWAGAPLVERRGTSVGLTSQGEKLLGLALQVVPAMSQARSEIAGTAEARGAATVTLLTGRTLARTVAADWFVRIRRQRAGVRVVVRTGQMTETLHRFERGEADFMLSYHHPQIALSLSSHQYLQRTVARDRLVPVAKVDARGQAAFAFGASDPVPYLAYAETLALGRLVADHLSNHPKAPRLVETIQCDSADALLEYALKGLGVAWLPWSLAAGACKARQLVALGGKPMEIGFEVRLVRAKRRLSPAAESFWQTVDPG